MLYAELKCKLCFSSQEQVKDLLASMRVEMHYDVTFNLEVGKLSQSWHIFAIQTYCQSEVISSHPVC